MISLFLLKINLMKLDVCELKRKTFLRLMNACKKVQELKKLLGKLETRYLIEAINCRRRALQEKRVSEKKNIVEGGLDKGIRLST